MFKRLRSTLRALAPGSWRRHEAEKRIVPVASPPAFVVLNEDIADDRISSASATDHSGALFAFGDPGVALGAPDVVDNAILVYAQAMETDAQASPTHRDQVASAVRDEDVADHSINTGSEPNQPCEPVDFFNQGVVLAEQGRTGEAIAAYTRAIDTDPLANEPYRQQLPPRLRDHPFDPNDRIYSSPKSFFNRGCVYFELGQLTEATEDFSHAIELCPEFNDAFANRANCYLLMGVRALADREYSKSHEALTRAKQDVLHVADREGGLDWGAATMLLRVEIQRASALCSMECSLEAWNACDCAIGMWYQLVASAATGVFPEEAEARDPQDALCRGAIAAATTLLADQPCVRRTDTACRCPWMPQRRQNVPRQAEDAGPGGRAVSTRASACAIVFLRTKSSRKRRASIPCNHCGCVPAITSVCSISSRGGRTEARCECLAAVECREKRRIDAPEDLENVVYLGGAYCNLGRAAIDCWRLDEAVAYLARSGEILDGACRSAGEN